MAERNPLDLYRKHFGFVGLPYPGTRAEQARVDILASADVEKRDAATIARKSPAPAHYLGTPIFLPVKLGGYQLPFEPLVEIAGGKSIVRTPLAGWNGSAKEDMGLDDYAITIRGIVLNEDSEDYPEAEVLQLRALFEKKGSLDIVCPLLGLFNISRIAIENLRLPAEEGTLHYQPYEFTGYSDAEVELLLRDDLLPLASRNAVLQR
jgi:hypothetical protein